jgi:molybdopterin-guanine dinucleotide biosynthesis protein B
MSVTSPTPLLGLAAWSGTGKTTLLSALIPLLKARGMHIAALKHTHHSVEFDQPGKDSHTLRQAGAEQVLVASASCSMLIRQPPTPAQEPNLQQLLTQLDHEHLDLILVEGFKHEAIPRIELHRSAVGKPLLYPQDPEIIAIALANDETITPTIPRLDLNNPAEVAHYIEHNCLHRCG